MIEDRFILALDQGTTGSTALLIDRMGEVRGRGYAQINQYFPRPGWVEHDPEEIWESVLKAADQAMKCLAIDWRSVAGIGITNQRETTILWDAKSGKAVHNAIVWQCRRTAPLCEKLRQDGWSETIAAKTGLVVDAYFSGTKIAWLLDNVPGLRERAKAGRVRFGTVDSWLIWRLTEGKVHATDMTNASRTMLFNLRKLDWDGQLLELLDIPRSVLPRLCPSSGESASATFFGGPAIPIAGVAGDQQAALFGQACLSPGQIKTTYGTGAFLLLNTGNTLVQSKQGLLSTIGYQTSTGARYALEGSIFMAGAVIQWLRDEMGLLSSAAESQAVASSVPDTGGVVLVPAFAGLGAPRWDMYARGTIVGLTRGSGKPHLVRAALESIAHQVVDVVDVMVEESGLALSEMRVDGGAAANDFLLQFQADLLGTTVIRPAHIETTAMGAAYLAGLAMGFWDSETSIAQLWQEDRKFIPSMGDEERRRRRNEWRRALDRALGWACPD